MSTFFASIQNPLMRCFAAAVIFCTLVPNIAVCECADCHCCEKTKTEQSAEQLCEERTGCSQERVADETLPACCRNTETDSAAEDTGKQNTPHNGCPCLFNAKEKVPAVIEKAVSADNQTSYYRFFCSLPALTGTVHDRYAAFSSFLLSYGEHSAVSPLRLHLLLQVLVI